MDVKADTHKGHPYKNTRHTTIGRDTPCGCQTGMMVMGC